jgi:TM2 domain-containing membrane protein YozV
VLETAPAGLKIRTQRVCVCILVPVGAMMSSGSISQPKSKLVAGLLGIFLGGLGIHRFYLGYTGIGIAQIAVTVCTCGFGSLWGLVEGIMILVGKLDRDAQGNPLTD